MNKHYLLVLLFAFTSVLYAQHKCDTVFINGQLHLQRDVSAELRIVEEHIDKEVQPHSHQLWAYYLSKPHPSVVVINNYFENAAQEFNVPVTILKTIGQIENNWTQTGPSIDKGWGIMHLVQNDYCNTLGEAAALLHVNEQLLKDDAEQNIRGAAALLAKYYTETGTHSQRIEDWYPAVKKYTGLISDELRTIQANRYYGVMIDGAHSTTLWGETITLERNPNISFEYITTTYHSGPAQDDGSRSSDYGPAVASYTTCNFTTTRNHSIDTWVNHWIGTGTAAGAVSWFQNCSASASAHFVTANNGTIYQVVPVANAAWHCGASGYPYNNGRSIGQEHEATNANPGLWNSTAMLQASATMACYFCSQYSIPTNQNHTSPGICGHQNMPGTNTDCPGTIPWTDWFNYFNTGSCSAVASQPANDYCGNETVLTVYGTTCGGATTADLNGATQSTAPIACGGYTSTLAKDIWFKFTATSTAHDITVVPSSGLDAVVDLRSGCPGTNIDCADGGGGEGATEVLHATGLTVGATYNVRVYDYTGANNPPTTTTFTICVTTPCTVPVKPVISGSHTTCQGQPVTLSVSNTCNGCTYSWSNGGSGAQTSVSTNGSYTVTATNNCATTTSDAFTVTVTSSVTPSVSISATATTICAGTQVTFTATPANGGTTPTYQWTRNGAVINGATGVTYSTTTLANGDVIRVVLTCNAACATSSTATSNAITINVTATVVPDISITSDAGGPVCTGTTVTYTATAANAGNSPVYTWKMDGATVGSNSVTYTTAVNNIANVWCVLQSGAACATPQVVNSDTIAVSVIQPQYPQVYINANSGSAICTGQSVVFTATANNAGTTPVYQWRVNGTNVATGNTWTTNALNNGDVVRCLLTSNAGCLAQDTALSTAIVMNVSTSVSPTIQISTASATHCSGDSIYFSTVINGGGASPQYQWFKNGVPVSGATATILFTNGFATGDVVRCRLVSSAACAVTDTVYSNAITLTVNPNTASTVSIAPNVQGAVCETSPVSITASSITAGTTLTYRWFVNGTYTQGGSDSVFVVTAPVDGDTVICYVTTTQQCPGLYVAQSNALILHTTPALEPQVSIASNQGDTICAGTVVTFTASSTNGGNAPVYEWFVNGSTNGTGPAFSTTQLATGSAVTCKLTSSLACVTSAYAMSDTIYKTVLPEVLPAVTITSDHGLTACADETVNFTAATTNAGTQPVYQWSINGQAVGSGSVFSSGALANGDVVRCQLTTSLQCVNSQTVQSNAIQMQIGGSAIPVVQANGCELAAQFIPNVTYQWYANSNLLQGATSRFYTVQQPAYYYVVVTDSALCRAQSTDIYVNYPACVTTVIADIDAGALFTINEIQSNTWQVKASGVNDFEVELFNATGQLVHFAKTTVGHYVVDLEMFSSGIYVIRLKTATSQYFVKKLVRY
jgi:N-acetyl-anhydromuramyl-L-alanine amidase AmpD